MKALLFAALASAAVAANAATISGTVSSGAPLAGMTVAAYTTAGTLQASSSTSASGAYSLTVPSGSYHVLAYDPAGVFATSFYADAESFETSSTLTLTSSQTATNINFALPRAGFAVGRVTSPSGAPLANMTVAAYNLSGTRRGFTKTDATGSYTLSLPPGSFKIAAFDDALKYATAFFDNAASFDAATPIALESTQSVTANLRLPLAADVTGTVTDGATAAPLANMRATAYAADGSIVARALTGNDGRFAFAVRPASLRVVVDDPAGNYATDYVPNAESFSAEPSLDAVAGQTVNVNISLLRAAHLAGRAIDRASGASLAGITAVAYNASGTTRAFAITDAAGAYSIVVPSGDYRVGVYDAALAYLPQLYGAALHAIAPQTISGLDFALVKGARITGRVEALPSRDPLAAITVGAYDLAGHLVASTMTDTSGQYTLLLSLGTVKLLAFDTALQFATTYYLGAKTFEATAPLALFEGESLVADFAMSPAGRVAGSVVDATTSAPLAGMEVIAYDASFARIAETTTDAAGTFRFALPAGTYTIAAGDSSYRYAGASYPSPVAIATAQDAGPIQIRLTRAAASARHRAARH